MNITCNRAALYEAVQLAGSIVPSRTPKPILQCAKLQVEENGQLTVMATDGEMSLKHSVPQVEVKQPGSAVIPADRITAILRETTEDTIHLEVKDATCQVSGKDSVFHIYGHDPDDFYLLDAVEEECQFEIGSAILKKMIIMTVFSVARESTRYAINGVLWECRGKKLRFVATDGRRLAQIDGSISGKGQEHSAIVPVKTMLILEKLLEDPKEMIKVGLCGNRLVVRTAMAEIAGNLVQGRFPKYTDVIPGGCDKKIQLQTEPFRSAMRRAALLSNEQSKGVSLAFSAGKLLLSSSTPEAGDAEVSMDISYDGGEIQIGFNPQYMLDMLRVLTEAEFVFELSEPNKPGLIRAGSDFLYVVMPVAV